MNRFSIKDIENLTGIRAHTIRIWEQRYGILQPKRTPTNIRYYDADDLKIALRVALLNGFGYKISRIHRMTATDMNALIQKINDTDFRMKVLVNDLLEATLAMDTASFESLVDAYIRKHGIEQAVEELIFRFLEKVGIMWMTDRLMPAQEHLASNILYRKLAVAIEQLPERTSAGENAVLLFLPEGEVHEMGLLYVYYLLSKQGVPAIYLGPNTPVREAQFVYASMHPKYVYVHLTSVAEDFDSNKYIRKLSAGMPDATVLVSGSVLKKSTAAGSNVRLLHSLVAVREAIQAI